MWRTQRADAPALLGAAGAVVAIALLGASRVFDLSFDGQTYHQTAIRLLAGGWNPIWDPRRAEPVAAGALVTGLPKGAWMLEAQLWRATGSLEAAKGVHGIALAAAFLLAWAALEALGLRRRAALAVAALAAFNPVAITQLLSFYLDGLVASFLLILLAALVLLWRTEAPRWAVAAGLAAALLANLKFPALVTAALIGIAALGLVALRRPARLRAALGVAGAAAALALAAGINPYVTNAVVHGSPAYPARGPDALPLVVHRDPVFAAQPRPVQLFRSLFSRSSDQDERAPRLKLPFSVHADEVTAFGSVDTRIGGWGPWFGGALLLAAVVLAAAHRTDGRRALGPVAVFAALLLSALVLPFGYYSRYAPQLWLAGVAALLADPLRSSWAKALAVVLAVDAAMVGPLSLGIQLVNEHVHRVQLREVARDAAGVEVVYAAWHDEPFDNVDLHLAGYGVRARPLAAGGGLPCAAPALLVRTHALLCYVDGRSPPPAPDPAVVAERVLTALRIR